VTAPAAKFQTVKHQVMRVPYKKSFQGLKIIGLATERCYKLKEPLVRMYFQLSEPPPLGWSYIFTTIWRSLAYPTKRQTGVEMDAIWIDCIPEEVETNHIRQLEDALTQTNDIYKREAIKQANNVAYQSQLDSHLKLKLEELSQALYPTPSQPLKKRSLITRLLDFFIQNGSEKKLRLQRTPVLDQLNDMRDYHHSRFEGASIAPDGRSLMLDYYDHDQGGTRFCFRYVISTHASPRLISGYTHEDSLLDYEIPLERIPRHVFKEAQGWLTSRMTVDCDKLLTRTLVELSEYLKMLENTAKLL
jgi:hypothetical protein